MSIVIAEIHLHFQLLVSVYIVEKCLCLSSNCYKLSLKNLIYALKKWKLKWNTCRLSCLFWVWCIAGFNRVDAMSKYYSHCRKHEIEKEAQKLFPCGYAAKFVRAPVSKHCCAIMEKKLDNPNCVCGLFFSRMAHKAGFRPEVTLTIPKCCNIALRPVGQLFTRRLFIYLCMKVLTFSNFTFEITKIINIIFISNTSFNHM